MYLKKIFSGLLLLLICNQAWPQKDSYKIDSVFNFYFFIFKMETTNCCPFEQYRQYYDTIISKNGKDTVYLNKYVVKAATFIQKISGLKTSSVNLHATNRIVNTEMIEKWEAWYKKNRSRLKWSRKLKQPVKR